MVDGITWEEETQARIRKAQNMLKGIQETMRQQQAELDRLKAYVDILERALELDRQYQNINSTGHYTFDAERLRTQTTWRSLLDIMDANNGVLVARDAATILVEANVFKDREHARNVIYSTLYSHKRELQKIREGVYQRKDNNSKKEERTGKQPTSGRKSGLQEAIKELKDKNPSMTNKEVLNHLLRTGFPFNGKRATSAVNIVWAKLGYSQKGKQQPLLEVG